MLPAHRLTKRAPHKPVDGSLFRARLSPTVFVRASLPAVRLPLRDVLERDEDLAVIARVVLQPVQQPRLQGVLVRVVLLWERGQTIRNRLREYERLIPCLKSSRQPSKSKVCVGLDDKLPAKLTFLRVAKSQQSLRTVPFDEGGARNGLVMFAFPLRAGNALRPRAKTEALNGQRLFARAESNHPGGGREESDLLRIVRLSMVPLLGSGLRVPKLSTTRDGRQRAPW